MNIVEFVSNINNNNSKHVKNVIELLQNDASVPFISRYRKEQTGGMDEVEITAIRDGVNSYNTLTARQKTILNAIEEQAQLTPQLKEKIESCFDPNELEDIYLPFKQKRQTKGEKAKKLGLEGLAKIIMSQRNGDVIYQAERYVKGEVYSVDEAIDGAIDIIAEWINENASLRARLRSIFEKRAVLTSKVVKGKDDADSKYKDYFDHSESLKRAASHRFLAIVRGTKEGVLRMKAQPDKEEAIQTIERFFVKANNESSELVARACKEAYTRLLSSSLESEAVSNKKEEADKDAINVFAKNLRQLLLGSPLGEKRVLAIDPGFKSGCKVVCLDAQGNLLNNCNIYPHPPQRESSAAKNKLAQLVQAYKIEAIAIGDGTAGRETESLVKHIRFDRDVQVFIVNEDGASIYSASSVARKEFPDYDVTVRGAVSIGRRLMDPLAELVKIDPKSIGVGQYQHDVNQTQLKSSLDDVIVSCVNKVGVDINTASPYLLNHVSGLGMSLAENIVAYREEVGRINSRAEIKKVKRLGAKAFEQAAGFLRITDGKNVLDNSAVHPESYPLVEKIAKQNKVTVESLIGNNELLKDLKAADFGADKFTFDDVIKELRKPTRDPRKAVQVLEFDKNIRTIEDLQIGMKLRGIVTNVTNFGAFVNIGIKENGLIHKSQLADVYVEDPSDFISLQEHVDVVVISVDVARKRVGLKKNN